MKAFIRCAILLLACLLGPGVSAKTAGEVEVGQELRNISMRGLSGPAAKLADFRGKPLIINVWASWCGPCRAEMASLDQLAARYGGQQLNVIGISTDDYPEAAQAFLRRSNTKFRQFIDYQLQLENMLGADHVPLTLLINAKGRVLYKFYGAKQWDQPEALELIRKTFQIKM